MNGFYSKSAKTLALGEHGCIEKTTQINYSLKICVFPSAANSEATIGGLYFQSRSHGSRLSRNIRLTFPKPILAIQLSRPASHWVHLSSKERLGTTDRETVLQIAENLYLQYFLGFSEYKDEAPFDHSLMTHFRKRFDKDTLKDNCKKYGIRLSGPSLGRPKKVTAKNSEQLKHEHQQHRQDEIDRIAVEGKLDRKSVV